jgi:3',5'-cyclic AMP phosphodiesterase CpdA
VIEEINLIYPDFVVASGDIGDNPEMIGQNEVRQYERVKEVLLNLDVPIYIVNGNHDYDSDSEEGDASILEYRDLINPYPDFSWDYGQLHFIGLDSGKKSAYYGLPGCMMGKGLTDNQMNWLQSDLDNNDGGGLIFAFMHHTALDPDKCPDFPYYNSSISRNQMEFLDICKQNQISMVLTGHTHIDEVWARDGNKQTGSSIGSPIPPLYIQTKSVTHDDFNDNHGYRLVRISGSSVVDYTYDKDGNGLRDGASSLTAGELGLTFFPSNNASVDKVTATIENNLHEDFDDVHIVFKMPKPITGKKYYAINGTIEQNIEGPNYDVYYVKTDISKQSIKDVILQQGYPIELNNGWNLISLPLIQPETDLKIILSSISGSYDAVQYYNRADKADYWEHYNSQKPLHLNDLKIIDHTMGIWIHITNPQGITLLIDGIPPSNPEYIHLRSGWNLVGYPSLTNFNRSYGLNNLAYDIDVNAIWTYNAASQKWEQLGNSDYFQNGRGYYIHSKTECDWEVPI